MGCYDYDFGGKERFLRFELELNGGFLKQMFSLIKYIARHLFMARD